MSTISPDELQMLTEQLCAAADSAAAVLTTGERLAGPAAPQDGVDDLVIAEDLRGAWSDFGDGSTGLVFIATSSLPPDAQGPDGSGVVVHLESALESAAAALGTSASPARVITSLADVPASLTVPDPSRPLVGAGIFEGDAPVIAVGIRGGVPAAAAPEAAPPMADPMAAGAPPGAPAAAPMPQSAPAPANVHVPSNLHLLSDVELGISAELGRTVMSMGELLDLQPGGIIELSRTVGQPIDVMVNGTLIARGEVVVVEDFYAVRVTEVVSERNGE